VPARRAVFKPRGKGLALPALVRGRTAPSRPDSRPIGSLLAWAALGLLTMLCVALWRAPASVLDPLVARFSEGRLRLADTSGTVWNGRARIVLADVREVDDRSDGAVRASALLVPGMVVPGVFSWAVSLSHLLTGELQARIEHDSMSQSVVLSARPTVLQISAGSMLLPSLPLERLGSPWTTIRPTGSLAIKWDALTVREGRFEGQVSLELSHAASALSPVRPLGAYRVQVVGAGAQAGVTMTTLNGPLVLEGTGNWNARSGLRFTAQAQAQEPEKQRLLPLLGLLGRREGDRILIKIGA